jgi:7-carboxy-7-deazaguanine synthase
MSPKLAHSTPWRRAKGKFAKMHETRRVNLEVIQQFIDRYNYQLKFVVDDRNDFTEIQALLGRLANVERSRVLIMAQGKTSRELRNKTEWIIELCKDYGFRYAPRLHIELFGNRRGT